MYASRSPLLFRGGCGKDCMQLFPSCACLNSPPFSDIADQAHVCVHTHCFHAIFQPMLKHLANGSSKLRYDLRLHSFVPSHNNNKHQLHVQAFRQSFDLDIAVHPSACAASRSTSRHRYSRFRQTSQGSQLHSILPGPSLRLRQSTSFSTSVRITTSKSLRLSPQQHHSPSSPPIVVRLSKQEM